MNNRYISLLSGIAFFIASVLTVSAETESNNFVNSDRAAESKQSFYFTAFLDDDPIGYHYFDVTQSDNRITTIVSEAEFDIKFLFMTVYRYKHNNIEVWNDYCLTSMNAVTDDNGDNLKVTLSPSETGVVIETQKNSTVAESCVRSFAYWDPDLIKHNKLLNSQTGELIEIDISYIGSEVIQVKSQAVLSERFQISGKDKQGLDIEIDLWYSENKQWLALRSKLENGSYLHYRISEREI